MARSRPRYDLPSSSQSSVAHRSKTGLGEGSRRDKSVAIRFLQQAPRTPTLALGVPNKVLRSEAYLWIERRLYPSSRPLRAIASHETRLLVNNYGAKCSKHSASSDAGNDTPLPASV